VIARAVALDAQQVAAGFRRVLHGQIDEEPSDSDLGHDLKALFLQNCADAAFEVIRRLLLAVVRGLQNSRSGENEILLQRTQSPSAARSLAGGPYIAQELT